MGLPPERVALLTPLVTAVRSDLVRGGFNSNFDAPGAMPPKEPAADSIPSYLALSTACEAPVTGPQTGFDLVWPDLENLGRIGVLNHAQQVITEMKQKIAPVETRVAELKDDDRPTVFPFEYNEGTATPYAPGNQKVINAVLVTAGGRNLFADQNKA
ncbi:hypothetical protein [Nonomuraea sp. KM90]|uniref:hypothetical protein n=1 Tax=Nonomuraea sp. KM90 TaxID=3457428 RepID=UPI003FCDBE31